MPDGLELVTLLVDDASTARAFYRDVLGFPVRTDRDGYVEFATNGLRLALFPRTRFAELLGLQPSAVGSSSVTLSVACEDPEAVDRSYANALTRGAPPVRPPGALPWGGYAAFIRDPTGNVVEFHAR